jgi:UDP-glucose 4-epimerase
VLAKFITSMLAGESPTIYGDGEQSRDFTYIDNAIAANLLACSAPASAVAGKMFNVATGQRYSLNQTYALLQKLTGYAGAVQYAEERAGDIKHSLADIGAARQHLGYEPAVDFEEGLKRTVAWYRQERRSAGFASSSIAR